MEAYKIETILKNDGEIKLDKLPFHAGESVEIIILSQQNIKGSYSLRNTKVKYIDPTKPVAEKDWEMRL